MPLKNVRIIQPSSTESRANELRNRVTRLERVQAPAAATTAAMWPLEPQALVRPTIKLAQNGDNFWTITNVAADAYGTIKYQSTVDGDGFQAAARLGPYGSRWGMAFVAEQGSDCGKMTVQAWVGPESYTGWTTVPSGGLQSPYNASHTYTQFVDVFTQDLYAAASSTLSTASPLSAIDWRILGTDGTALTAITGTDPDTGAGVRDADGGSGVWWFRVKVNGKNASSSAYRVTLRGLWVVRMTHDGFLV